MAKAVHPPLLPRRDVALGVLPYYHIYGTRLAVILPMLANKLQRHRDALAISPLLRLPLGHLA